ncbi:hypothetical protein PsorP6_013774 [Peronosclerospora sorghi]|uniref:Uncharacterized protein n=1 Tax=Peronosclerospora sorghi TaxID=230839 RepID=A0ACC0VFB2_9STRA|nr:hypothetical protein PsorP6_013774 [Peronosclerospora sorghi]
MNWYMALRRCSTAAPRKEYPTSFISHLRKQKLNIFNIGIAFLTLSLSSQMVAYKQRYEKTMGEKEHLNQKVEILEKMVLNMGGVLPDDQAVVSATEAAKEKEAQAFRDREEEIKALVASESNDKTSRKNKLI